MTGLREAVATDFERILRLNEAEEHLTSPLTLERLIRLVQMSSYCKVATVGRETAGFLIAFREGVPYESENYRWFDQRLSRFLYVDRIVVGAAFSRQGIGSRLYGDLFAFARLRQVETIACEYNVDPPNPASRAFHDRFGFTEIGTRRVAGGNKQVSLQIAETAGA